MNPETTTGFKKLQRTANRPCCPECGTYMKVVDCRRESGVLFIWFGCTRDGCTGQKLKKISSTSPSKIEKAV